MSKQWRTGILLVIACLVGFTAFFILSGSASSSHESWDTMTREKIGLSRAPEGGYTDFPPDDPDLYSTYYFSLALKNQHRDLVQKEPTRLWLYSRERAYSANPSLCTLKDVYYLAGCMKNYDIVPENRSGISSLVARFRQPDGSYADRPGFTGSSLDTMRALEILDFTGDTATVGNVTRQWLRRQWINDQGSTDGDFLLAETQVLVPALHGAGIDMNLSGGNDAGKRADARFAGAWRSRLEEIPGNRTDLFTLSALTREVRASGELSPELAGNVRDYVYSLELPDGGYNAIGGNYGESQGTYLAVSLLSDLGSPVSNRTIGFIRQHESRYGGFRPAFRITPTPKETWYAIRAQSLLSPHDPAIPAVRPWLDTQMKNPGLSWEDRYYLVMTYGQLNEPVPDAVSLRNTLDQRIATISGSSYEPGDMEQVFSLLNMAKVLDPYPGPEQKDRLVRKINELQNDDGGFGPGGSDLATTYFALGSLAMLSASPDNPDACAAWIGQGYAGDGGYRYRRGTMSSNFSYITPTFMSIASLSSLHRSPATADTTLRWIDRSRYAGGGISLMPVRPETGVNDATFRENLQYTVEGLETEYLLRHRTMFPAL